MKVKYTGQAGFIIETSVTFSVRTGSFPKLFTPEAKKRYATNGSINKTTKKCIPFSPFTAY